MTGTGAGTVTDDKSERPSQWRRPRHRHVLATPLSLRKYCHKQRARTTTDSQPDTKEIIFTVEQGRTNENKAQIGKWQVASGGMQQKMPGIGAGVGDTAWRNQIKCRKHGIEGRAKSSHVRGGIK